MIISRAPVRITLGGGGTDLPSYYEKYEGFLISGAINKYLLVGANQQFYNTISLKYSKQEVVKDVNDIKHNLFREALKLVGINKRIELTSLADIPAGSGLGSSGAFLISLLNTLYLYKSGIEPNKRQLAENGCKIELEILQEHEGKQDKYACSFGGIRAYKFYKNGKVSVIPLANADKISKELEKRINIFFTGNTRQHTASDALKHQDEKTKKADSEILEGLHNIKQIGIETKKALENDDYDAFGRYLNEHWEIKKKIASSPPNAFIEKCYNHALKHGVLGGKVMGASTDVGFFMFYHPGSDEEIKKFNKAMMNIGLHRMNFNFDNEGVKAIFNGGK